MIKALLKGELDAIVKQRRPGAFLLYSIARRISWAYNNEDLEFSTNGERWILGKLGLRGLTTVFDVGANIGDWTAEVLAHSDSATLYCYEAIPTTFAQLKSNVANPRVHLFNKALSNEEAVLEFNASDISVVSSVYDVHQFDPKLATTKLSVQATTGDLDCERNAVTHIDLLKVDTEGHDLDVLKGFSHLIDRDMVDIIQFEYNAFTLFARNGLFDFYDALSAKYFICRLLPSGLELMGYERGMDNFLQSNWICLRKPIVTRELVTLLNIHLPDGHRRGITLESLADQPEIVKLLN